MISRHPTAEELRQHSEETFDAIQAGWVKQPPGAGFENALLSIFLQQMVASYEIAAQLVEINGILRDPRSPADRLRDQARGM